ncbi:PDZ and LIM domain protein Zasp isoform X1 [Euwallacea similis]|uniref:PDZ and LIM domain protein Zasp isoform X1 n=1 Tax=Euwallacea similis TaxID=1736056 RepID=UPI00344B106B
MAATLSTVRLNKGDSQNWGFRLQGGKDFGSPLVIQKVNGGSPAERAGLIAGDSVIRINNVDVYNLAHKDAQDVIVRAGPGFEMVIQRGGSTWKPTVIPTGTYSKPSPSINNVSAVTQTSLCASKGENIGAIGTGHNLSAKPFAPQVNGAVNGGPKLINNQYNTPLKLYSEDAIAETISAQSEVLSTGALGVNFKKNEKNYDATNSAVYRMLKEAENDHDPSNDAEPEAGVVTTPNRGIAGLRHVSAPQTKPAPANPQLPPGQNICAECERLIVGVFVRIKDKNLHVECFKCATCGSSLKNVGYYNINNKLYCDVHAKSAAIASNNSAAIPISSVRAPASAISSALSGHSLPVASPLSPKTPSFIPSYPLPEDPISGETPAITLLPNLNSTPSHDSNTKPPSNSTLYNSTAPVSFSKYINKSSNIGGPRPFSSVSAPLSPGDTLPRAGPLSPPNHYNKAPLSPPTGHSYGSYSPASTARTTNVIWPPPHEDSEVPTACPLFYPPPSKIEAEIEKKSAIKRKTQFEKEYFSEETDAMDETLSFYSEDISLTGRRSASECLEILSETLDTQKLVENVMKSSPNFKVPPMNNNDVSAVNFEASCVKPPITECCQKPDSCDLKRPTQYAPNTLECHLSTKIENTVPQKWESPLTQAVRTTAPDPDTFSLMPSRKAAASPMACALAIAPTQPYNLSSNTQGAVSLPEETEPYFPPEHPIIPLEQPEETKKKEERLPIPKPYSPFVKALEIAPERPFTPVGGPPILPPVKKKPKDSLDKLLDELPRPSDHLDMRCALTTAPERPYTPLIAEYMDTNTKKEQKVNRSDLIRPLKPEELPASFKMNVKEAKPPSYYAPVMLEERIRAEVQESLNASESKEMKIIEKETVEPAQVSHQIITTPQEPQVQTGNYAPMFQGFTCSFKNKTDHSQFSVEVSTTPPVLSPPPKAQTPISYVAVVEEKPARITREKIVEEKSGMQQMSKREENITLEVQRQAEEVVQVKPVPVNTMLRKPEGLPSYQMDLKATAEADLILIERKQRAEARIEEQRKKQGRPNPVMQNPVITVAPSDSNYFHDEKPPSGTFSPRPRSITPSMINKAPPLLPYYQDNLVPHFVGTVETNVFDPAHPEISRTPSPHPESKPDRSRSPSPFPGLHKQERAKSPAEGPPPNPLKSSNPLPNPQDSKINVAKQNLQTYLPEYKNQRDKLEEMNVYKKDVDFAESSDFHSQNVAYPNTEFGVRTGNVQQQIHQLLQVADTEKHETQLQQSCRMVAKTDIAQKTHQEHMASVNETQSSEVIEDGTTQVHRRRIVTEEYEHNHKEKNIEIATSVTQKRPFCNVNTVEQSPVGQSFHITNPHHNLSSKLDTAATLQQASNRLSEGQSQVSQQFHSLAPTPPPPPPVRKVFPPGSLAPIKHVALPNKPSGTVTKPIVPKPDVGAAGGRQTGGITSAPKRGRGLLNTAALPGSRIPLCGHCHGQVRGPFITALGKIWCPQHFTCMTPSCKRPLQDIGFVEERGQLYCEYCFEQYLAPPCSKCNSKIKADCLKAIGKNFHPECFNCVYCGKLFGNSPFFLEDGNPYCETDWNELFTTKCFACGFPVEAGDRWVEALSNNYHSQCFNCTMCKKNLEGQSFFAKGGRPFCKNHAR